jgi:hypothetical protein
MPPVKHARQWIAVAIAAFLGCGYVMESNAAITPPKLGSCKPAADEPPADNKQKTTGPGGKGETRPASEKPAKRT